MAERTFWSGAAVPRSKSATMVGVVLHLVARSFWVRALGWKSARALAMTLPTSLPIVLGLTMSSDRSTFVRRWPSTPGRVACVIEILSVVLVCEVGGKAASARDKVVIRMRNV